MSFNATDRSVFFFSLSFLPFLSLSLSLSLYSRYFFLVFSGGLSFVFPFIL